LAWTWNQCLSNNQTLECADFFNNQITQPCFIALTSVGQIYGLSYMYDNGVKIFKRF